MLPLFVFQRDLVIQKMGRLSMERIIILDDFSEDYDFVLGFFRIMFPECLIQFSPRYTRNEGIQSGQKFSLESSSYPKKIHKAF